MPERSSLHPRLAGKPLEAPYTEAKVGEVVLEKVSDNITLPQFRTVRRSISSRTGDRARRRIAAQHLWRQSRHGRIHGLWHIIKGALQASGRAGSRQVKDAKISFAGASAPIVAGTTLIFVSDSY